MALHDCSCTQEVMLQRQMIVVIVSCWSFVHVALAATTRVAHVTSTLIDC